MQPRPLRTITGPLDHVIEAAPSKSETHRALVTAVLGDTPSVIHRALRSTDTLVTCDGLRALGASVDSDADPWRVTPLGRPFRGGGRLELRDSGTSMRFLLAVAALGSEPSWLDGFPRLRERPLRPLAAALARLGADIALDPAGGGLPARAGGGPLRGGSLQLPGDRSSQFASALLLVGARLGGGIAVEIARPWVSLPYVELTARVLEHFGIAVERPGPGRWNVVEGVYPGSEYRVRGDHSSSSYFLGAAAIVGGRVRVTGLDPSSAQPDAALASLLERMGCTATQGPDWIEIRHAGCLRGLEEDLAQCPDLVPALAVVAMFADTPSRLRGLAHLRDKESDRLEAVARNLRRFGCDVDTAGDTLAIRPPHRRGLRGASVSTSADHRLAMAFAMAGLVLEGVVLDDPACVGKSNPDFWSQYARLSS